MIFLLRCPKCKNEMKYQPAQKSLMSKKKKCVYCNHSYSVNLNIVRKL